MIGLRKKERIHEEGLGFNLINEFFPHRQVLELIKAQINPALVIEGPLTFASNNFSLSGAAQGNRWSSEMPQAVALQPWGAQRVPDQHCCDGAGPAQVQGLGQLALPTPAC